MISVAGKSGMRTIARRPLAALCNSTPLVMPRLAAAMRLSTSRKCLFNKMLKTRISSLLNIKRVNKKVLSKARVTRKVKVNHSTVSNSQVKKHQNRCLKRRAVRLNKKSKMRRADTARLKTKA